jgi:hypothetical protein
LAGMLVNELEPLSVLKQAFRPGQCYVSIETGKDFGSVSARKRDDPVPFTRISCHRLTFL